MSMILQVTLMDEAGNTREDLSLPKGTEELDKVADQIKEYHAEGREMVVTVLKVQSRAHGKRTRTNIPLVFCSP